MTELHERYKRSYGEYCTDVHGSSLIAFPAQFPGPKARLLIASPDQWDTPSRFAIETLMQRYNGNGHPEVDLLFSPEPLERGDDASLPSLERIIGSYRPTAAIFLRTINLYAVASCPLNGYGVLIAKNKTQSVIDPQTKDLAGYIVRLLEREGVRLHVPTQADEYIVPGIMSSRRYVGFMKESRDINDEQHTTDMHRLCLQICNNANINAIELISPSHSRTAVLGNYPHEVPLDIVEKSSRTIYVRNQLTGKISREEQTIAKTQRLQFSPVDAHVAALRLALGFYELDDPSKPLRAYMSNE